MITKAIIFDFGGVLVRTQTWQPRLQWDTRLGLDPCTAEQLVFNSEHGQAAQHGVYTEAQHWAWVGAQLGLSKTELLNFRLDFWAGDQLDGRLITFIHQLRKRVKTSIISNAMDGLRHDLTHKWGIADAFDDIVVSAEFGTMKPDSAIYHHALERLGVAAESAVFIDDFAHNIVGCEAVGINGIHYPPALTTDDLIAAIEAYL